MFTIIEGQEYQVKTRSGIVWYSRAVLFKRMTRLCSEVFQLGSAMFTSNGTQARLNFKDLVCDIDRDSGDIVSEVDEDRRRRHDGGNTIIRISQELHTIRCGKNNDVFSCGTASDAVLAQAEFVALEIAKLRAMIEAETVK